MFGQLLRLLIQLITLVVLSRLLAPEDFGFIAMTTAIVGLGELIRDLGLSSASIQARDLSRQQRTNLFWLSTVIGLLVAAAVAAAAPLVAAFYDEAALVTVTLALAVTFALNGASAQHKASLARDLRFRALAVVETISPLAAATLAICLAMSGWSYWSLVVQQIALALIGLLLVLVIARWLPGLPRRTDGMRPLLTYGFHLLGAQVVAYFSRNIDTVVLGQRFGATAVGLYSRAFELVINPLNQVNAPSSKVAVPILSRLQEDSQRYNAFLLRGQKVMLMAVIPVLAAAIATAEPLIDIVLGPSWGQVAPLFQILAVAGIVRICAYATYWIALSRGATKISLYVNLIAVPVYGGCVLAGSLFGVTGVAIGFATASTITWAIGLIWYTRAAAAPGWRLLTGALRIVLAVVPATAAAWAVSLVPAISGTITELAAGLGAFALVFSLTVLLARPVRSDFMEAVAVIRLLRSR